MLIKTQTAALEILVRNARSSDSDLASLRELVITKSRHGEFDPARLNLQVDDSGVQNRWGDRFFLVKSIDQRRILVFVERK